MNRDALIDWLNAFKADPFSTGADKVDRLLGLFAASVGRNPKGQDPQGLGAKHEHAVAKPDAQKGSA